MQDNQNKRKVSNKSDYRNKQQLATPSISGCNRTANTKSKTVQYKRYNLQIQVQSSVPLSVPTKDESPSETPQPNSSDETSSVDTTLPVITTIRGNADFDSPTVSDNESRVDNESDTESDLELLYPESTMEADSNDETNMEAEPIKDTNMESDPNTDANKRLNPNREANIATNVVDKDKEGSNMRFVFKIYILFLLFKAHYLTTKK